MLKQVRIISGGMLILLLLPVLLWCSGWHWHPQESSGWQVVLFAFTETVTRPRGIITTLLLGGWLLWLLRHDYSGCWPRLQVALMIVIVVWGGQGINTLIKHQFREARPYVVWLQSAPKNDVADFYHLPATVRSERVLQATAGNSQIAGWLKQHWAFETGYSFPSGHSMFAACWALVMLFWLWPRRHYITVCVTFLWAILVMWSRMALGMHWPWDVTTSVIIAGLWIMLVTAVIKFLRMT